jgi:hypothetical protein
MKYVRCEVCGQTVDTDSGEQSPAANWISVHQHPCMNVFLAAMDNKDPQLTKDIGDALEELLEYAENHNMFDFDLILPYFYWMQALFFRLRQRKDNILDTMTKAYNEEKEKWNKKDELIQTDKQDSQ